MDEFELIVRYFSRAGGGATVRLGIGDDGAVLRPPAGRDLVSVLDSLVDGIHYPRGMAAHDVGYRCVAVNLSDLAAMGAMPAWMLLGLTLPHADAAWLQDFADGLYAAANEYDVALVGGDTTRGAETVVTVQMSGHVSADRFLTRSGARAGDAIYVSGSTGDAAAGLELLQGSAADPYLLKRFRRPAARVPLGQALIGVASAAIDVSDGLFADLSRLLTASGCGGSLDVSGLPLSQPLLDYCGRQRALALALAGGDDYELCVTVPQANVAQIARLADDEHIALTRIGEVDDGTGLRCTDDGEPFAFDHAGYRHF